MASPSSIPAKAAALARKRWYVALPVALLVVLGARALLARNGSSDRLAPRRGAIVESIYGLGTVQSYRKYNVRLGVPGTIQKLFVHEGENVAAGAPLVHFDTVGTFSAPFAGVVTSVPFDEHETVFPQQTVVQVQDVKDVYIEVSLEQRGALRAEKGQRARLVFESLRNETFDGELTSVFPHEGEFIARIKPDRLPGDVLPGMTADVAIVVARREDALLVPLKAIDHGRVLRVRDGKTERVPVKVGAVDGAWAEVLEGDIKTSDMLAVPGK